MQSNAFELDVEAGNEESFHRPSNAEVVEQDEEDLIWEAIARLPSVKRGRFAILRRTPSEIEHSVGGGETGSTETIDVTKLDRARRELVVKKALASDDQDNYKLLSAIKDRLDRVGMEVPKVEVRFQNLNINANAEIGLRALPTLINVARDFFEYALMGLRILRPNKFQLHILKDISGIIKPGRMTLLLGPPGSGKSTLLLALAGKLDRKSLNVSGDITYNGTKLDEFYVRRTSAYIGQTDNHIPELTVRETFDFAARCQGASEGMAGCMKDLTKLEKEKNIRPIPEIDAFMKASSIGGKKHSISTDYVLKVLGLDICSDTFVGNDMLRGVSGGQRKRVTTGEMIVGPRKTLFMDEISTGLDSSTTFQIVKCMRNFVHLMEATVLMGLLQPAPETYELFDDVMLLSEGYMVYQGPRGKVLEFFESLGFKLPPRKGVADFLQEVTSKKDQAQYWADPSKPYVFIPVSEMAIAFKNSRFGKSLESTLTAPYDKSQSHPSALSRTKYAASRWELLNSCFAREKLLMTRQSFLYIFRTFQVAFVAFVTSTIFLRTKLHPVDEINGNLYLSCLFFGVVHMMFNGFSELSLLIFRLPVFYKQRDNLFHPAWIWSVVSWSIRVPYSAIEAVVWSCVLYYTVGFAPSAGRFFRFTFAQFVLHQMAVSLFRMLASLARDLVVANTFGSASLLLVFLLGGFVIPKDQIKPWWVWASWLSPLQYAQRAVSINEFTATRWKKISAIGNNTIGYNVLHQHGLPSAKYWYWLGVGVLIGYAVIFNIIVTLALACLNPLSKGKAIVPEETEENSVRKDVESEKLTSDSSSAQGSSKKGMILPFEPLAMTFHNVNYFVDMPVEMKAQGIPETRLQLLSNVSGVFTPGVLTALVGSSGAGKTTLMDVLSGRKTGGYIEGDIKISGYPKVQETFARISGYVEQNDIHSPQVTVEESLWFSSSLRLPKEISKDQKIEFVEEVMRLVELDTLRNAIVGLPGSSGLSTEQRKRLTIAVELVANPSIIFMDEPTSGLDARAAAIVMRTVRNTVDTGRTVVCTIHQPSIDIFEAFDELLLLKRGGRVIYGGKLGVRSQILIDYFQSIDGIPSIPDGYNPATWMLEITNPVAEQRIGRDFADIYTNSAEYREVEGAITRLSVPPPGSQPLKFSSVYSQDQLSQFLICLKKQNLVYWRSPRYNLVRLVFTTVCALLLGSVYWDVGNKRDTTKGLFMVMGALYSACLFLGINNASSVQPIVSIERTVFYREKAAGLYAPTSYAAAQGLVELPYIVAQTILFGVITYFMINFERTASKFFLYLIIMFLTFTYFTFYGLMAVGLTPSQHMAAVVSSAFYSFWNLLSGFLVPKPRIPGWWIWFYYICPVAWTLKGIISSQLGDVETMIVEPTFKGTVKEYVSTVFGIDSDVTGLAVAVLIGFCILFFGVFTLSVKFLNFQKR
ncbi:ABC transporter G family member 31-like [Gossypium arboreum]|uniref:ABC transporter G family member 31-like n=1 Tax=Gossypium arboreum TaxID=29729 RepID=UPI0022F1DBFA|nr:ABC transporter G family member 31-like [Gossypium arboreum]